jgi:hypothetical protein
MPVFLDRFHCSMVIYLDRFHCSMVIYLDRFHCSMVIYLWKSEHMVRLSDCCLTPNEQFFKLYHGNI